MNDITRVPARIVIERFPNQLIREFSTTIQLTKEKGGRTGLGGIFYKDTDRQEKAGEAAAALVKRVYELHGVEEVAIEEYDLRVTIGKAFDWENVQPTVLSILKTAFGAEVEVEVKERLSPDHFRSGTELVEPDTIRETPPLYGDSADDGEDTGFGRV